MPRSVFIATGGPTHANAIIIRSPNVNPPPAALAARALQIQWPHRLASVIARHVDRLRRERRLASAADMRSWTGSMDERTTSISAPGKLPTGGRLAYARNLLQALERRELAEVSARMTSETALITPRPNALMRSPSRPGTPILRNSTKSQWLSGIPCHPSWRCFDKSIRPSARFRFRWMAASPPNSYRGTTSGWNSSRRTSGPAIRRASQSRCRRWAGRRHSRYASSTT